MPTYMDKAKNDLLDRAFSNLLKQQGVGELPFSLSEALGLSDQTAAIAAKTIYVSPNSGNDANSGTDRNFPIKTLATAFAMIPNPMDRSVTIEIIGGGTIAGGTCRRLGATRGATLTVLAGVPGIVTNANIDASSYTVLTTGVIASNASDPDNANQTASPYQIQNWTCTVAGTPWVANAYKGKWLWITSINNGSGVIGTVRPIISNTNNTLEVPFMATSGNAASLLPVGGTFSIIDLNTTLSSAIVWSGQSLVPITLSGLNITGTGLTWATGKSSSASWRVCRQTLSGSSVQILLGSGQSGTWLNSHIKLNNTGVTAICNRGEEIQISLTQSLIESSSTTQLQLCSDFQYGIVELDMQATTTDLSNGADFYLTNARCRNTGKLKCGTAIVDGGSVVRSEGVVNMPTGLNKPAFRVFQNSTLVLHNPTINLNTSTAPGIVAELGGVCSFNTVATYTNGGITGTSGSGFYAKDGGIINIGLAAADTELVGTVGRFVCEARDTGIIMFSGALRGNMVGTLGYASVDGVTPVAAGALPVTEATELSRIYQKISI